MKKMKIIFNIIICIVLVSSLFSQEKNAKIKTVEGYIYSKQTGEPIEEAVIRGITGSNITSLTTQSGAFKLEIPSARFPFSFTVERLGYEKITVTSEDGGTVIIMLSEQLTATDEIEVTGSLLETNGLNNFYISSNINTIDELISKSPGITITRRGNYASEPIVRGMNSERTGVTINGMKITCACTDKMDPVTSYAETDNLESISLTKGSFDFSETAGSFAAINLKLKEPGLNKKMKLGGDLTMGYMSVSNAKKLETRLDFKTPKYGSVINFVYKSNRDYKTGNGEVIQYSGYNKINLSNSHILKLSANAEAKLRFLYDYAWDIGYPSLTMDVKSAEAFISGVEFKISGLSEFVKNVTAKAYFNSITHIMDDSHRNNPVKMDMPGWTKTGGAGLNALFVSGGFSLTGNAEFIFSSSRAEMTMYFPNASPMFMLTWPDVYKTEYIVSLDAKKNFDSKIQFSSGVWGSINETSIQDKLGLGELQVFYPDFKGNDSRIIGGFNTGVKYFISENISAGINYSYGIRSLSTSEQYAFYIFNRIDAYDYVGNPSLKNEKSNQAEINFSASSDNFKAGLSVYGYYFNDYIAGKIDHSLSAMTIGAKGVKIYSNIPSAKMLGFESTIESKLSAGFTAINTVQYSYGEDNSGNYLPQMPPLMGTLSLRFAKSNYKIQTEVIWAAAQNKVNEAYGETRTPSFAVFNLRLSAGLFKFLTVDAGIENILSRNYYEHLDWLKIPRPGRNLYFSVKAGF